MPPKGDLGPVFFLSYICKRKVKIGEESPSLIHTPLCENQEKEKRTQNRNRGHSFPKEKDRAAASGSGKQEISSDSPLPDFKNSGHTHKKNTPRKWSVGLSAAGQP
jgi:hypothetical protein